MESVSGMILMLTMVTVGIDDVLGRVSTVLAGIA
jgi:hypothetical protein